MSPDVVNDWWQRDDLCYQDGELLFAGHRIADLARDLGTPTFIYSFSRVQENLKRLHQALTNAELDSGYSLLYAMKANRFAPLLTALQQTGLCGIDACSPREVDLAVSCGFRPEQISFTAGSLSARDVEALSRYENLFVDCDSIHAIRMWGKQRPGSTIGIRVNPAMGVSRADNERLQYAGEVTTKFGIYREQFDEALQVAAEYGLSVTKIHFHTGCGYLTPELDQWDRVIEACMWFVERVPTVRTVNVGGGLGVPHTPDDGRLDLKLWSGVLHKHFANRGLRLELEPGEYLLKDAGLLLLGKTFLETKQTTLFLGVDAGFNIAPEPAYYHLPFQPVALSLAAGMDRQKMTVVGNINEALDVWYADALLPDMTNQSVLALINAGAYSSSMASDHCMRGQFREVLLT